jgi:hypothetical protein
MGWSLRRGLEESILPKEAGEVTSLDRSNGLAPRCVNSQDRSKSNEWNRQDAKIAEVIAARNLIRRP